MLYAWDNVNMVLGERGDEPFPSRRQIRLSLQLSEILFVQSLLGEF